MGEAVGRLDRSNTAIVVDSTSDMPEVLRTDPNVSMVPLNVHFGDETYRDWIDLKPREFYARLLTVERLPTTSQPSAGAFLAEYRRLREGFENVYSIHLSGKLSGTVESARLAQSQVDGVTVVDTEVACLAISLLVQCLLRKLDEGTTDQEFQAFIDRYTQKSGRLFMLDTLEYLQRGGRIGRASSLAGSLLNIKPLLTFSDGVVAPYKKVRGERKAVTAMVEYFLELTRPGVPVRVGLSHAAAPQKMEELEAMIMATDRESDICLRGEVGAVIGTYAGPGAVALFFIEE